MFDLFKKIIHLEERKFIIELIGFAFIFLIWSIVVIWLTDFVSELEAKPNVDVYVLKTFIFIKYLSFVLEAFILLGLLIPSLIKTLFKLIANSISAYRYGVNLIKKSLSSKIDDNSNN